MVSLGIDLGLSGALAAVRGSTLMGVEDIPTREKSGNGLIRREIDPRELHAALKRILGPYRDEATVFLENVFGMSQGQAGGRGQGVSGAFSLGETRGAVRSVLELMGLPVQWVAPQVWKRHFGLIVKGSEEADGNKRSQIAKARAREMAIDFYPDAPVTLVKHHNRAEAILIARFGFERNA